MQRALSTTTRAELITYLNELSERMLRDPDEFENPSTAVMFECTAAWAEGMDRFCARVGVDLASLNPWQVAAMLFYAGLVYE